MDFQIKILLVSFFCTIVLSIIIIPILMRLKVGQNERDDGPQSHIKKQGTPTMGGIIIMIATVIASISGFIFYYKTGEPEVAKNIIPLVIITFGYGLIGFIDDFKKIILRNTKGLKPVYKVLGLLIIAVIFVLYLTRILNLGTQTIIPFLKTTIELPMWFYIPFAIAVILATTNAINLTDGIDGLGASITAIIITCLTVIAIVYNVKEVVIFGSILIGVCIGFLMFNLNPAKIMMGDTGSLLLGGVIASLALYLKVPLLLLIIAAIPVLETLSVMMQVTYYKRTGHRIFKMAPLHHHFELSGWKENKVVSVFCFITLAVCILGMYII